MDTMQICGHQRPRDGVEEDQLQKERNMGRAGGSVG